MAKVTMGPLASSISGKLGGVVFQSTSGAQVVKSVSTKPVQKTITRINMGYQLGFYNHVWNEVPQNIRDQWGSAVGPFNKMYKKYGSHAYTGSQLAYQYWARVNQGLYGVGFPEIIPNLASTAVSGVKNMDLQHGGPWLLYPYNDYPPLNQWLYISIQRVNSLTNKKTIGRKYYVVPIPVLSNSFNLWPFLPPQMQIVTSDVWLKFSIYNVVLGYWYSLAQETLIATQ